MMKHPATSPIEQRFPGIPWRQPIAISVGNTTKLVCRLCIMAYGLKAAEINHIPYAFNTEEEWQDHMQREH